MDESKDRESIPEPIKREVRQRCGFGCVICGVPVFDYDHIIEYSTVQEHKADNLTLLCTLHHREKTRKLLTREQVIKANENPFNIQNRSSTPYNFHFEGDNFELILGETTLKIDNINPLKDFVIPFLVNNKKLLSFEIINNQLFFNIIILDKNGSIQFKILENEMIYNTQQWDIEFVGTRLKLREGARKIILDIEFILPNKVHIHQAEFNYQGYEFIVKGGVITSNHIIMKAKEITNFRIVYSAGEFDNKIRACIRC